MNRGLHLVAAWVLFGSTGACGRAAVNVAALDELDRVRESAGAVEGRRWAPEAYARAEQERDLARQAHVAGDDLAATLHAERAVAAYGHALADARLARATTDLADAQKSLDDAAAEEQSLEVSRAKLEREAQELEQRVGMAHERALPASSAAASPEREAARAVVARSLAMQARLLCGAARLIAPEATALAEASGEMTTLDDRLAKNPRPVPIDDAARIRARCLEILTRVRRDSGDDVGANDALLSELSAAGGWDPTRDERGVAVVLHEAFHGIELTPAAATRLQELARIAASHPGFALQIVVHDAPPAVMNEAADAKRADAAVRALAAAGAAASRVRAELAGTRAPIVDPSDAKNRARNERLEVVFVNAGRAHAE